MIGPHFVWHLEQILPSPPFSRFQSADLNIIEQVRTGNDCISMKFQCQAFFGRAPMGAGSSFFVKGNKTGKRGRDSSSGAHKWEETSRSKAVYLFKGCGISKDNSRAPEPSHTWQRDFLGRRLPEYCELGKIQIPHQGRNQPFGGELPP